MLSQKGKGILTIISSCLVYLVIGYSSVWGNINLYIVSLYNFSSDVGLIVLPINGLTANIGILSSFFFVEKFGYRQTILFSSLLLFGFLLGSSFCPTFWPFFCCFGIGFGITSGWIYLTVLYNCYKYFPNRRGLIGGIILSINGLSSVIFNYLLLWLINPDDVSAVKDQKSGEYRFPEDIANRVPISLRYMSFAILGLLVLANFSQFEFQEIRGKKNIEGGKQESLLDSKLNSNNKEQNEEYSPNQNNSENNHDDDIDEIENQTNFNDNDNEIGSNNFENENCNENKKKTHKKNEWSHSSKDSRDEKRCFSLKEAAKTKVFYLIVALMYLSMCNGYFMNSNFKNYGITKISDDYFLTLVGSVGSLFNSCGRFFWGVMADKFRFKRIYLIVLIIQMVDIVTLRFISEYKGAYLIWVCIALLCEGSHFVIFPPLCLQVFGPKIGSRVYSLLILVATMSSMTQFGLNTGLRPVIGYENEFYIYLGFTIVAFILVLKNEIIYKK